eukprot:3865883-Lingulodinium_polyedra.AAC.1
MFHDILRLMVEHTFTDWDRMMPVQGASEEQDDDYRTFCRSKTWRMRRVLQRPGTDRHWALICWIAAPLDHLWQRLQYLDANGRVLNDCTSNMSPFSECSRAFMEMLETPIAQGPLSPVFWRYGSNGDHVLAMVKQARELILSMASQVWWRFQEFTHWPIRLVQMVDPRNPDQLATAREFWQTPLCCKSTHFCQKVMRLFQGPHAMHDDVEFRKTLETWSRVTKVTNMHIERLFAQMKQASADTPMIE